MSAIIVRVLNRSESPLIGVSAGDVRYLNLHHAAQRESSQSAAHGATESVTGTGLPVGWYYILTGVVAALLSGGAAGAP